MHEYPWIERPINIDYGTNIKIGSNVFINFNCTILDTCLVSIGSRTLIGPNVSFFSGTHPLDPDLRNGTSGPELGGTITVGNDCWIAGNAMILPGVTIGDGCTIGAGSVVTKVITALHAVCICLAKECLLTDIFFLPRMSRRITLLLVTRPEFSVRSRESSRRSRTRNKVQRGQWQSWQTRLKSPRLRFATYGKALLLVVRYD